jgi:2-polyprenyl-3-methyl-5-hydroxy-6-metoxy-1,4-benzoquinol methylase
VSKISFDNYGKRAERLDDPTLIAGRLGIQKEDERNIAKDVLKKLDLRASDSVLDIGCNVGNLLIPLSFSVKDITGIDHPSCLERLKMRFPTDPIRLIPGDFLDTQIDGTFSKILCYSVLHYLKDEGEVLRFVDKCLSLLSEGGMVLLGDIPNQGVKRRFLNSARGKRFDGEWRELAARGPASTKKREILLDPDTETVQFDDDLVLEILGRYRGKGYHTYVLPQPPELPFGNSREDILIVDVV